MNKELIKKLKELNPEDAMLALMVALVKDNTSK